MTCRHLVPSDEACVVTVDGAERPAQVMLCDWPDQHPERLLDAPRWVHGKIGTGLAVSPERDCVRCPAFSPDPSTARSRP